MAYRSFEELEVWKRACLLAVSVYELLEPCRDYGIKDQMQRSAVSIACNIAEGCERGGKDFARFLRIAQGSSAELRTQFYIARRIGLINEQQCRTHVNEIREIAKMITGLSRSLNPKPEELS